MMYEVQNGEMRSLEQKAKEDGETIWVWVMSVDASVGAEVADVIE